MQLRLQAPASVNVTLALTKFSVVFVQMARRLATWACATSKHRWPISL